MNSSSKHTRIRSNSICSAHVCIMSALLSHFSGEKKNYKLFILTFYYCFALFIYFCSGAAKAWGQAHFGKSSGRVWLDEVRCTGNELSLEQCTKSAWGEHNCLHSEDAGVSCHPLTGISPLLKNMWYVQWGWSMIMLKDAEFDQFSVQNESGERPDTNFWSEKMYIICWGGSLKKLTEK